MDNHTGIPSNEKPDDLLDVAAFARLVGLSEALARHRIGTDGLVSATRNVEPLVTRTDAEAFKRRHDGVQAALAEMYALGMEAEDVEPDSAPRPGSR